jgi:uncharacterized membrane protein (UPF0127 family)
MSRRFLLFLVVVVAVPLAASVWGQEFSQAGNLLTQLTIGDVPVTAEVVSTPEKLYKGLSHRKALPEGQGMLFLLDHADLEAFCMRDMLFSIDIIWIANGKVVGIEDKLSPDFKGDVTSPVPVRLVLEVPGGFAERHNIKVGDPVRLKLPGVASEEDNNQ